MPKNSHWLMLSLCLLACHSGSTRHYRDWFGNTTPPARQVLVFDNWGEPNSLDPAIANSTFATNVVGALFEGLVQNNPLTTQPMAALATHYEVAPDGMQLKFY